MKSIYSNEFQRTPVGPAGKIADFQPRPLRVRDGYRQFNRARTNGRLDPKIRVKIALAVAQATLCEYWLVEQTLAARRLGLTNDEIIASRESRATDSKTAATLEFARDVIACVGGESTIGLKRAGYDDREIVEIVANVGFNLVNCYGHLLTDTDVFAA
jgi:AhpD family alkylhydroperoxidase